MLAKLRGPLAGLLVLSGAACGGKTSAQPTPSAAAPTIVAPGSQDIAQVASTPRIDFESISTQPVACTVRGAMNTSKLALRPGGPVFASAFGLPGESAVWVLVNEQEPTALAQYTKSGFALYGWTSPNEGLAVTGAALLTPNVVVFNYSDIDVTGAVPGGLKIRAREANRDQDSDVTKVVLSKPAEAIVACDEFWWGGEPDTSSGATENGYMLLQQPMDEKNVGKPSYDKAKTVSYKAGERVELFAAADSKELIGMLQVGGFPETVSIMDTDAARKMMKIYVTTSTMGVAGWVPLRKPSGTVQGSGGGGGYGRIHYSTRCATAKAVFATVGGETAQVGTLLAGGGIKLGASTEQGTSVTLEDVTTAEGALLWIEDASDCKSPTK